MADYIDKDGITLRLGGSKPIQDRRDIQFSKIVKALPPPPPEFNSRAFLMVQSGILQWFDNVDGNDQYGCCVLSARTKSQRIYIVAETGEMPNITVAETVAEYLAETGGFDNGLSELVADSTWRRNGYIAGGKLRKIQAYAAVDWNDITLLKTAISTLMCVHFTIALPLSAQTQVGGVWELDTTPNGLIGSWGWHEVNVPEYKADGTYICQTWGKDQVMSAAFVKAYVQECKVFVPSANALDNIKNPVDTNKMLAAIAEVSQIPDEPVVMTVSPTDVLQGNSGIAINISGQGFTKDADVSFGEGITVKQVIFVDYNNLTVIIDIANDASALYRRAVTVNTGIGAFGALVDAFGVIALPPVPPTPIITTTVTFNGTPTGASVVIDGSPVGTLPMSLMLAMSNYAVAISAPGYITNNVVVDIVAGESHIFTINLTAAPAKPCCAVGKSAAALLVNSGLSVKGVQMSNVPVSVNLSLPSWAVTKTFLIGTLTAIITLLQAVIKVGPVGWVPTELAIITVAGGILATIAGTVQSVQVAKLKSTVAKQAALLQSKP